MREIKARVSELVHKKLKEFSQENNVSMSKILNDILHHYFGGDEIHYKQHYPNSIEEKVTKKIRLTLSEIAILERFAELNNHSLIKEITFRIINSMRTDFTLTEKEIDSFFSIKLSIDKVGRNINQLNKNIGIGDAVINEKSLREDIDNLNKLLVDFQKTNRELLIRATERCHYEIKK